jgi:hypothetical protein
MNARRTWIAGLAALGWMLNAPAHAYPDDPDGTFMVARDDRRDDARPAPRNDKADTRSSDKRDDGRDDAQGYGYGYERRQQQEQGDSKDRSASQPRR